MDMFKCAREPYSTGMHASVHVAGRKRHTSLGTGAAEGSNGAHEDNEGHKRSHSNANDHRHWERFCREQQRDMSFYNNEIRTLQIYIKFNRRWMTEYITARS